jgi:hypothetical protein
VNLVELSIEHTHYQDVRNHEHQTSVSNKKLLFYTVISKNFKLRLGNLDTGVQVKEKLAFGEEMQRTARLLKVRNEVITEKLRVTQTILGRKENNVLNWCGQLVHTAGNRWPKRI